MKSPVDAGFDRWKVFQLLRFNNYLGHRETYRGLRHFLKSHFPEPFKVLDLGCGNALPIAVALRGLPITRYIGVDTSSEMLAQAGKNLAKLKRRIALHESDALRFVQGRREKVDVVWMGLLFHHFPRLLKLELLHHVRRLLKQNGCLLAHDPLVREVESRKDYLRRMAGTCDREWLVISPADKFVLYRHWGRHGMQERFSTMTSLARKAGFSTPEILWRDKHDLFALMVFSASGGQPGLRPRTNPDRV